MMTKSNNYSFFKNHLRRLGYRITMDKKNSDIRVEIPLDGKLSTTEMHIVFDDFAVTLYAYVQPVVDEKSRASAMEYLIRANHLITNGCFDMSPDSGEVRFRVSLCCFDRILLSEVLIRLTISVPQAMLNYYGDGLLDVMSGVKTAKKAIDAVLKKHRGRVLMRGWPRA